MTYKQVCRLCFLGIDNELKNDASSVYTTDISSSFFPIPTAVTAPNAAEYENQRYGVEAVGFTKRTNTKRMRFSLNGALNNINLSNKAKIIIESVTIPDILSHMLQQSICSIILYED